MGEDSNAENNRFVDVKKVFYRKNPSLARLLPNFIFNYIKRIVHEKEINHFMARTHVYHGLEFIEEVLKEFNVKIQVSGFEKIPDKGRFIFVANHPMGGIDGLAFAKVVGEKFQNIKFIVNDILMNVENFKPIFVPVNKHGKQSTDYVRQIEALYQSDAQILNFPAGLCSRKNPGGRILDRKWYKSFVSKARKHQREVVPVYIFGRNSNFFYNLANIREKLGVKANLEMFFLPDEMFKQKNVKIHLKFGEIIPHTAFDKTKTPDEWAFEVKKKVYELGQEPISD